MRETYSVCIIPRAVSADDSGGVGMTKLDFSKIGNVAFEQLVRSLALQVIGAVGTVYPSGRDAGRDFTFDGNPPSYSGRGWSGYGILQAKCRENPDRTDDAEWLIKQLKAEEQAFLDPDSARLPPKYYIIATNVVLSGADGRGRKGKPQTGGLTKVHAELERWKTTIGIDDYDIWPADKIESLLDAYPSIRQSYAIWITPSDILSALHAQLTGQTINFESAFRLYLKQSLKKNILISLKNSGDRSGNKVRASQVFVDLPVANPFSVENPNALDSIVSLARQKLTSEQIELSRAEGRYLANKIVLLGGPGQGKSTLTNYLVQLFRSNLLVADGAKDRELEGAVSEIIGRARAEGINTAIPSRLPLHISLPDFADVVSAARRNQQPQPSLLKVLAGEISALTEEEISASALRKWLKIHPSLIVCDGLDEVPPSGERAAIIDAIVQLETDLTDSGCDFLLVVTTRPQGYNNDLGSKNWSHWVLLDLLPEKANAYARALSAVRYPEEADRAEQINLKLAAALNEAVSQRLMRTPLQITIMHLIVDIGEGVPVGRWALFDTYFDVLLRREITKGGAVAAALERNRSHLLPIHEWVGMLLQTRSEHAGSAGSFLTREEFKSLLSSYLSSNGFFGPQLESRVEELDILTVERLVLLSTREEGRVSFDVRSLQEYTAAGALTSGDPMFVQKRLSHIAGKAHWRHVFLIAASRVFSNSVLHHLRATVCNIPRELDTGVAALVVARGARLALEMFLDGIGADSPTYRRQLAIHALEVLELGDVETAVMAADLAEDNTSDIVIGYIKKAIQSDRPALREMALAVTGTLAARGEQEFVEFALQNWPSGEECLLIAQTLIGSPHLDHFAPLIETALLGNSPNGLAGRMNVRLNDSDAESGNVGTATRSIIKFTSSSHNRFEVNVLGNGNAKIHMNGLFMGPYPGRYRALAACIADRPAWRVLDMLRDLAHAPSKEALANYLEGLLNENLLKQAQRNGRFLPWQVTGLIDGLSEAAVAQLIGDIRDGDFGDGPAWEEAERRWIKSGVTEADFVSMRRSYYSAKDGSIAGAPVFRRFSVTHASNLVDLSLVLLEVSKKIQHAPSKAAVLRLAGFLIYGEEDADDSEYPEKILKVMEGCAGIPLPAQILRFGDMDDDFWFRLNDGLKDSVFIEHNFAEDVRCSAFIAGFNRNPSYRNLLTVICHNFGSDEAGDHPKLHDSAFQIMQGDSPEVCKAVSILRLKSGHVSESEIDHLLNVLFEQVEESYPYIMALMTTNPSRYGAVGLPFLQAALSRGEPIEIARTIFQQQLNKVFDSESSSFRDRGEWFERFGLPPEAAVLIK